MSTDPINVDAVDPADPTGTTLAVSDEPIENINQRLPLRSRRALQAIGAFLGIFILAAIFIPIGGAVIGGGALVVEGQVKRIAHPTGGVIAEINVKDGARVKRGELLMRLETTVASVRADLSGRTVAQLLASRARLEAEREGRGRLAFPATLLARQDKDARDAMASEQRLFSLHLAERSSLRAQLEQRIVQIARQLDGYHAQIVALQKQQALIGPERAGVQELWDKGLVTIARRNQLERTAADLEGSIASLEASIAQANAHVTETREQIIQVEQSARSDAGRELAQVNNSLNEQQVQEVAAGDAYKKSDIRAPYGGVIDKLAFSARGDVVQSAQAIMEIVPDSELMIAEVRISPADIDRVKTGQEARVKFTAFAASQTPELPGKLIFVSADRTTEQQTGVSYYRVRIEIDPAALKMERLKLVSGMPVETFISTGSRSMMSYVTKPLTDQFSRSFRD